MAGRIVVFGATGYTGRLAVAALAARGARPLLAGRDRERLERLAAEHGGLDCAVASAGDPGALGGLLGPGDVLLTTVGPFTRFGHGPLDAAIGAGAHYVDATGEPAFIRHVFTEAGPRAERAGVALLTAFGFDFVPGNLAGALAARQAGPAATRLDIGYFTVGTRASSGTLATAGVLIDQPSHLRQGGQLRLLPFARRVRTFADGDRRRRAALFGGTEPLALPRVAPGLRDVAVLLGALGRYTRAAQAASFLLPVAGRLPPVKARIRARADRLMATTGKGPDEAARARARTVVIAVAADRRGRRPLATVRLTGQDAYGFTGAMLADAAQRLAGGQVAGVGALGPVDAYGLDELEAACATAGTVRAPA